MNMKKITLISVALILASASAFAWSKRNQNDGNLGRMYISAGAGATFSKYKLGTEKKDTTGAHGEIVVNAPVFKPGVNAFRDIKWAGLDVNAFFNYDYGGGRFDFADIEGISSDSYSIGVGLTPYLNINTGLPFLKAIKPFGIAYCGYQWTDFSAEKGADGEPVSENNNYFIYGVGGGVEFVLLDQLSFTPTWQWRGNAEDGVPCYQVITAELAYWFTSQFCVSAFWTHNIGVDNQYGIENANLKHADIIGLKFKIGFIR